MTDKKPTVLLVNPWVRDFKCYDEWMEPVGLLWISSFLKQFDINIEFINCLDRFNTNDIIPAGKNKKFATGNFSTTKIEKPEIYECVHRTYKQYGISEDLFRKKLKDIATPDLILVTSSMTYWSGGVKRSLEVIREHYKDQPLLLGGVFASLCEKYASEYSEVDEVLTGSFCKEHLNKILAYLNLDTVSDFPEFNKWPSPDYDLLNDKLKHRAIVSTLGCPFRCTYCASHALNPDYFRRSPIDVVNEIENSYKHGITDFAFYDDALLYKYKDHLFPILEDLIIRDINCNIHTPNGMHAKWITPEVANLLFKSGFKTVRVGFETDNTGAQKITGSKVTNEELKMAIKNLREAGFEKNMIGVYLIVGINGESWREILPRAKWIQKQGACAYLNFLSPVPFTPDYKELSLKYPIIDETPLAHNDLFFAFYSNTVDNESFKLLKQTVREGNA